MGHYIKMDRYCKLHNQPIDRGSLRPGTAQSATLRQRLLGCGTTASPLRSAWAPRTPPTSAPMRSARFAPFRTPSCLRLALLVVVTAPRTRGLRQRRRRPHASQAVAGHPQQGGALLPAADRHRRRDEHILLLALRFALLTCRQAGSALLRPRRWYFTHPYYSI